MTESSAQDSEYGIACRLSEDPCRLVPVQVVNKDCCILYARLLCQPHSESMAWLLELKFSVLLCVVCQPTVSKQGGMQFNVDLFVTEAGQAESPICLHL